MTAPTSSRPVRLRVAPSPTGDPHVGTAYVSLFDLAFVRQQGGAFVLRIEDTDQARFREDSEQQIFDTLHWLGLNWDEGPDIGGPFAPYRQSERLDRYTPYVDRLLESGHAYHCWCSTERLAQMREAQQKAKRPTGYDRLCYGKTREDRAALPGFSEIPVVRMLIPDDLDTRFTDLIRGELNAPHPDDQVIVKADGFPTYHLAVVVDDHEMGITHVVRGEDHVPGTPKYLLLRDALGLGRPEVFAHLPMLVNEGRQKLSKRKDAVSVADFAAQGYLPEAMVNYLVLLGWGPKDGIEIRPLAEFVELFRLEDVTPSPAFFDVKKLQHINAEYLRALPVAEFLERARPFLSGPEVEAVLAPIAALIQERVRLLTEIEPMVAFLLDGPLVEDDASWDKAMVNGKNASEMLDATIAGLVDLDHWVAEPIRAAIEVAAISVGLVNAEGQAQLSKAQGPVRVAITGRSVGPPLFESLEALGQTRTLDRLRAARARL